MSTAADTVVIGAGIAGLAYAHARGDADVVVLEADERAGGLIRTEDDGELRYEAGPETVLGTPAVRAFLSELGLRVDEPPAAARRRYVLRDFRLVEVPTGPGALVRSPLLSFASKLGVFGERFRGARAGLDGSVADFARARFGDEVLERLVDPFVSGVYAGDPEQLSMRAAFPEVVGLVERHGSVLAALARRGRSGGAPPAPISIEGGLGEIPRAISARMGERLRFGCRAERIVRRPSGWRVETPAGPLDAERVVLATPARAASRLLEGVVDDAAAALARTPTESLVSVVHVWPASIVGHALDGFGYLVPSSEGRRHLGTLFSSTLGTARGPADHVVLRTMLGGARHPDLVDAPDRLIERIVRFEVSAVLGLPGNFERMRITRWRDALPRYDLDHLERRDVIDAALAEHDGLALLGNYRDGVSVASLIDAARRLAGEHAAHA